MQQSKAQELGRVKISFIKKIADLEKKIDEKIFYTVDQMSQLQAKLDDYRNEIERIIEYRTKGAILRSKTRWHNEGEKTQNTF